MQKDEKKDLDLTNDVEILSEEDLENVTGGRGVNPPRVNEHPYDKNVKSRM